MSSGRGCDGHLAVVKSRCCIRAAVGMVNKIGADYIGLLVLGFINAAIGADQIRAEFRCHLGVRVLPPLTRLCLQGLRGFSQPAGDGFKHLPTQPGAIYVPQPATARDVTLCNATLLPANCRHVRYGLSR